MVDDHLFKKVSILVALAFLAVLAIILIWQIAAAIILGLLLAYIFYPVYKKILKLIKEKNTAAIILILLVIIIIFIPIWLLLPYFINQVFNVYLFLQKLDISVVLKIIFPSLSSLSQHFVNSFNNFISSLASNIFSSTSSLVTDLPNLALKFVVVLFVFFFGMRDGKIFLDYLKTLSPFSKSAEEAFTKKFKDVTNSVIYGFVVVGVIQGIITGLGLLVFGVNNALILTIIAIITSIIPVLGAWVVWIPSAIYLMTTGSVGRGIGLFLFGIIVISWIDNILRAYIVSKKSKMSSAVVLVGMIGGLLVFGILGLVIGPLILAYLLLILDAYRSKKLPALFS